MALLQVPLSTHPSPGVPALRKGWPSLAGRVRVPVHDKRQPFSVLCAAAGNAAVHVEAQPDAVVHEVKLGNGAATAVAKSASHKKPTEVPAEVVLGRSSFPPAFTFGAASAAYQIEGATNEGGRGPSIWDTFIQENPERIANSENADVACDSYHRYKDDVKLLKDGGMDAYRFSIAWPRILPRGSLKGGINKEGIQYYNNLIDELLANGIKPYVTLFHWDLPQALEDEYHGFLDRRIVDDFKDYCEICFREFGDRVKHWITLNEPWMFTVQGYEFGNSAPGRCSKSQGEHCSVGNSAIEPYTVSHNLILAHAAAARLYKDKFQAKQKGEIGVTLVAHWMRPYSNSKEHVNAADRALDFMLGWYLDPIVHGDYPFTMKALVRERLPCFTAEEKKMIKGSYDFIGINYYTSRYAYSLPFSPNEPISYSLDQFTDLRVEKEGVPIGEQTEVSWLYLCPEGIRDLLVHVKKKYRNPTIYITENGTGQSDNDRLSFEEALDDQDRIKYYTLHLAKLQEAIKLGVNVKGYFAWTLLDNFEWVDGYATRFGLSYVDYTDMQNRYPKASHGWFNKFLSR